MTRWNAHLDEAKQLYAEGYSLNSIAKKFGGLHGPLSRALKRAGVTLRPRYERGQQFFSGPNARSPQSQWALAKGSTGDQAERIHYREVNIAGLTRAMKKETDEVEIQWIRRLIEEQMTDIEKIISEGREANIDTAGT